MLVTGRGRRRSPLRDNHARRHYSNRTTLSPSRHPKNLPLRQIEIPPPRHFQNHPSGLMNYRTNRAKSPYLRRSPLRTHRHLASHHRPRHLSPPSATRFTRAFRRQSIERGRSPKRNSYFSALEKECTTYFFTNFLVEYGFKDLCRFFGRVGAVGDITLPHRRDVRGRRFGFVRFKLSEDASRLDELVKNLYIGKRKLIINKPRFSRGKIRFKGTLPRRTGSVVARPNSLGAGVLRTRVQGRMTHGSWSDAVRNGTNRTILATSAETNVVEKVTVDAVTNGLDYSVPSRPIGKPVEVDFNLEIPNDLVVDCKDYAVADLEFGLGANDAVACLFRNGVLSVQVVSLDCSTVLLKGLNFEEVEDTFNSEESWWRTVFARFRPWNSSTLARDRKTSIRCSRIPVYVGPFLSLSSWQILLVGT